MQGACLHRRTLYTEETVRIMKKLTGKKTRRKALCVAAMAIVFLFFVTAGFARDIDNRTWGQRPSPFDEGLQESLPENEDALTEPKQSQMPMEEEHAQEPGEIVIDSPMQSPQNGTRRAYQEGEYRSGGIYYWCYANGEAAIRYAKPATGNYVIPKEIVGLGGETYLITEIGSYREGTLTKGAFSNSMITGLSFEEGSQIRHIAAYAFSACYRLAGKTIILPDTVTYIGTNAFYLYDDGTGIGELRHKRVAQVTGSLPYLETGTPLSVPEEATQYESTVNSTQKNVTLHKGASWTNELLSRGEIRIDYGKHPNYNGKMDFIFVMDYSNSMLESTEAVGEDGVTYTYPRSFLTHDVVLGISRIILESGLPGYDNRVAMTAFGGSWDPLWSSDFTADTAAIEQTLFTHPVSLTNSTHYGAGLQGAIDLINNRENEDRTPVVIFLSDGEPNVGYGTQEAQTLRAMGVKV
jgi:hypothetical protein